MEGSTKVCLGERGETYDKKQASLPLWNGWRGRRSFGLTGVEFDSLLRDAT
jgi:hypothetical protein